MIHGCLICTHRFQSYGRHTCLNNCSLVDTQSGLITPWSEISLIAHILTVKFGIAPDLDSNLLLRAAEDVKIPQTRKNFKFLQPVSLLLPSCNRNSTCVNLKKVGSLFLLSIMCLGSSHQRRERRAIGLDRTVCPDI